MNLSPLVLLAAKDRHTGKPTKYRYDCKICGCPVSTYNCNSTLLEHRPKGEGWDWFLACDNADCTNSWGEGFFQSKPDWVKYVSL